MNSHLTCKLALCYKMFQMTLPMGVIQRAGSFWRLLHLAIDGESVESSKNTQRCHTSPHYGGRHERSPRLSREFQKSLVYSCTQACTQNCIGCSRLFLSCKEPSKVPESSIGDYNQVRASFGQSTKQVSSKALVKLPFYKSCLLCLLKLPSHKHLSLAS